VGRVAELGSLGRQENQPAKKGFNMDIQNEYKKLKIDQGILDLIKMSNELNINREKKSDVADSLISIMILQGNHKQGTKNAKLV
jgi:hypothetical protein